MTRSPGAKSVTWRPTPTTSPASSMPGMSGGEPPWSGVEACPLHQVRRVQPGRPHRHEQLGVTRHGVVPLLPAEPVVADDDGVHAGHPRRARAGDRRCPVGSGHGSRHDIPIHTLQGDDAKLERLRRQDAVAGQRGLQVRPDPAVRGSRGACRRPTAIAASTLIGFPCNQFMGQEPGSAEEIVQFCSATYGVTFPLMEKIEVNGEEPTPDLHGAHGRRRMPRARRATSRGTSRSSSVSPKGDIVARHRPQVDPEDPAIVGDIEAQLPA